MQQRQSRNLKDLINELISFLSITSCVTLIIQFNSQNRGHRSRIAQQKIHVLSVDLVFVRLFLVRTRYKKDIGQIYFGADEGNRSHLGKEWSRLFSFEETCD